jgi:hypothetical protein
MKMISEPVRHHQIPKDFTMDLFGDLEATLADNLMLLLVHFVT